MNSPNDPRAAAVPSGGPLALAWSRDGRTVPAAGQPADLILRGEDALSRSLRARAADGTPMLAEFQRDAVDPGALPASWGSVGNAALLALWRRRIAAGRAGGPGPAGGGAEWPPLILCREKGRVFRPPSPLTGLPDGLDECRDEEALRRAQLPAWGATTARFLTDAQAGPAGSPPGVPRFYCAGTPPRGAGAEVASWDRLARDLGRVIDFAVARGVPAQVRERFPCIGCGEVPRCFARAAPGGAPPVTAALAPSRLVPVTFYPAAVLVHREETVDFGEHADLLGGARWAQFRARHAPAWTHAGTRVLREAIEGEVSARTGAVAPIDAFRAKLQHFEAVADAALAHARATRLPHLALTPSNVVSHGLRAGASGRFDVSLRGGLRGMPLDDLTQAPPGPQLWLPPPEPVPPFAHPDLVRAAEPAATAPPDGPSVHEGGFRHGRFAPVRVRVGRVWGDAAGGSTEFELDLLGLDPASAETDAADRVRVVVNEASWAGVVLWCRRDTERASVDGLPLRAFPVRLDSGHVLDLESAARGRPLFGQAAVYRSYGAHYDLYALGMLLARSLLENARQSLPSIARDVLPALVTFCNAVRGRAGADAWDELAGVISNLARTPPHDAVLADVNVCFDPREAAAGGARVPPRLWAEALSTIAACLASGRGAGFCRGTRADPDANAFLRPYEDLLTRVRSILQRIPAAQEPAPPSRAVDPHGAATAQFASPPAAAAAAPARSEADTAMDLGGARIRELEVALAASAARCERLEAELTAAKAAPRPRAERPPAPSAAGDAEVWRVMRDALTGPRDAPAQAPRPDDPAVTLVRTALVEGLQTMSSLHQAVAELAGQEVAAEQRNLERMVRTALLATMEGAPDAREQVEAARAALSAMRARMGSVVATLVEAHGHSSRDGARQLLMTFAVAARKELDLSKSQDARLGELIQRIGGATNELVGRLFDPVFQSRVRASLQKAPDKEGRNP